MTSITTHKKTYSASTMFVTHGIPSFFELLRKCIINFSQRISLSYNSIITACMTPTVSDNHGDQCYFNNYFLTVIYLFFYCMYVFFMIMFYCVYGQMSEIKNYIIIIIIINMM